jgi:uncharacterized protein YbaR (Trm112 family)
MNTHTFDNHYLTCPICQKNATPKPVKSCVGLFSCPYCQEKLVVSQSGHYVRDPFILRQIMLSSALRRQSRPLARILRDFMLLRPMLTLAVGGVILFGMLAATQQNTSYQQDLQKIEKTDNFIQKQ